ncbi:MAG TPA: class II aldolase/adducin family protein [Dehalococcoidia bacterium]|nr:class II aldolase/adducin family protein [Dehalococcoidia bacterium]
MIAPRDVLRDLVIANRVLGNENVVDAYGHVSLRNPAAPDRFFLSCSLAPAFVGFDDILEFTLDGRVVGDDSRPPYLERFIHGAIYEARPDVNAVIHAHAEDTLPFGISQTPLVPVIHSGAFIGAEVPVWDVATSFGNATNLLVTSVEQGRDLARCLAGNNVVLMRGHGFAAAAPTIIDVVRMAIYLPRNARVQLEALRLGDVKPLSAGEIAARTGGSGYRPESPETQRAWRYWAQRAGCADLLS